jgi:hypothetical protein
MLGEKRLLRGEIPTIHGDVVDSGRVHNIWSSITIPQVEKEYLTNYKNSEAMNVRGT